MTTTHEILRRRIQRLYDEGDAEALAASSCSPEDVLTDFEPSAEVAAWLTWEATRDGTRLVGFTELLHQHNNERDRIVHLALDKLGAPRKDDGRDSRLFSVLERLIELVAARGAA